MKIKPNRAEFRISQDPDYNETTPTIHIQNLDDEDDDYVQINHKDFNKYWNEDCECVFSTDHFQTVADAKAWCLSIGMTENPNIGEIGG